MARSVGDIQDEIEGYKDAEPELAALNSVSTTAIWRLWVWVVAQAIHTLERLWNEAKADIRQLAAEAVVGTTVWMTARLKEYRHGNTTLYVNPDSYLVQYLDPTAGDAIVAFASVRRVRSLAVFKVAKDDGSGRPTPLSTDELVGLRSYANRFQSAGTRIAVQSTAADKLRLNGVIYFDGIYNEALVMAGVEAAVDSYLASLPFDGRVDRQALEAVILATPGVKTLFFSSIETQIDGGSWATMPGAWYDTAAGYISYDAGGALTYEPV